MERRVITLMALIGAALTLLGKTGCLADKLSPDQKAPPFAKGSGGLILKAPFEGGGSAADVGRRRAQTNPAPPVAAAAAPSTASAPADGVVREETEELKEVDGQLVRVVKGNFAYDSPEGLPIAVKYVADENGNRASFTFGTGKSSGGVGSGSGGAGRPSAPGQRPGKPGPTPGGPGATSAGAAGSGGGRPGGPGAGGSTGSGSRPGGGQTGASTYLPPTTKVDRSYLPPN